MFERVRVSTCITTPSRPTGVVLRLIQNLIYVIDSDLVPVPADAAEIISYR